MNKLKEVLRDRYQSGPLAREAQASLLCALQQRAVALKEEELRAKRLRPYTGAGDFINTTMTITWTDTGTSTTTTTNVNLYRQT